MAYAATYAENGVAIHNVLYDSLSPPQRILPFTHLQGKQKGERP
jgi:hypothetical protein